MSWVIVRELPYARVYMPRPSCLACLTCSVYIFMSVSSSPARAPPCCILPLPTTESLCLWNSECVLFSSLFLIDNRHVFSPRGVQHTGTERERERKLSSVCCSIRQHCALELPLTLVRSRLDVPHTHHRSITVKDPEPLEYWFA